MSSLEINDKSIYLSQEHYFEKLKSQLSKESQLSSKVNLNVAIQKKRQEIEDIKSKLC